MPLWATCPPVCIKGVQDGTPFLVTVRLLHGQYTLQAVTLASVTCHQKCHITAKSA